MANYRLTNLAVQDLTDIWSYTVRNWSEAQADFYYDQLIKSFELIASNPEDGRHYPEIRDDLFGLRINKHIVFYRVISNDSVEITRILYDRMDLENRLK